MDLPFTVMRPLSGITIPQIKELHPKISAQYPGSKERRKWEGKFEFKDDKSLAHSFDLGVDGYLFESSDKLQIVQFRLDGFTFSRLRPYQTWESLRDEAQRLWGIYKESVNPIGASRLAVRYINQLDVALPANANEYFTKPPQTSSDASSGIESFFSRMVVNHPEGISSIVIQAFEKPENSVTTRLLLDIDVFKLTTLKIDDRKTWEIEERKIWEAFELLRQIKNKIFFSSITSKTKEICQ